jgi:WD40 repeat protein
LESGEPKFTSEPLLHLGTIGGIPIAAGNGLVACAAEGDDIWTMDLNTGVATPLRGHDSKSRLLAISDGVLVSTGDDKTLRRWNLATLEQMGPPIPIDSYLAALAVADGVIWTSVTTLQRYDLKTGETLSRQLRGAAGTAALAVDNRVAVSGFWDGTLKTWDLATGEPLRESHGGPQSRLTSLVLYKGFAISGSPDETVCVWNLTTMEPLFKIRFGSSVNGVAAHENGICVACAAGLVRIDLNL